MMLGLPAWEEVESPKEAESMAEAAEQGSIGADENLGDLMNSKNQATVEKEMETGMIE